MGLIHAKCDVCWDPIGNGCNRHNCPHVPASVSLKIAGVTTKPGAPIFGIPADGLTADQANFFGLTERIGYRVIWVQGPPAEFVVMAVDGDIVEIGRFSDARRAAHFIVDREFGPSTPIPPQRVFNIRSFTRDWLNLPRNRKLEIAKILDVSKRGDKSMPAAEWNRIIISRIAKAGKLHLFEKLLSGAHCCDIMPGACGLSCCER